MSKNNKWLFWGSIILLVVLTCIVFALSMAEVSGFLISIIYSVYIIAMAAPFIIYIEITDDDKEK